MRIEATPIRHDARSPAGSFFASDKCSDWLAVVACVIAFGWMYSKPLSQAFAYAPWVDTIHLTGPLFCEASRQFGKLQIPEFNWINLIPAPYIPHFSPFYPFYFLGLLDYCSGASAVQSQDIVRVIHNGIFFINVFVLGRVVELERAWSILAAALCTLSVDLYIVSIWPTIIASMSWVPLAIAGLLSLLYHERYRLGSALLIASLTFMLFAGPASNALAPLVFVALVFSSVRVIGLLRAARYRDLCTIAAVGLCAIVAVAALNLGSAGNFLAVLGETIRWTRTGTVVGYGSLGREILADQQGIPALYGIMFPDKVSYDLGNIFVGPLLASLAITGAMTATRSHRRRLDHRRSSDNFSHLPRSGRDCAILELRAGPQPYAAFEPSVYALCARHRYSSVYWYPFAPPGQRPGGEAGVIVALALMAEWGAVAAAIGGEPKAVVNSIILVVSLAAGLLIVAARNPRLSVVRASVPMIVILASLVINVQTNKIVFIPVATSQISSPTWTALTAAMERIKRDDPAPGRLVMDPSIHSDGFSLFDAGSIAAYVGLPSFQVYLSPTIVWKFTADSNRFPDYDFYALRSAKYLFAGKAFDDPRMESAFVDGPIHVYRLVNWRPWVSAFCPPAITLSESWPKTKAEPGRLPDAPAPLAATVGELDAALARSGCDRPLVSLIDVVPRQNALRWHDAGGPEHILIINLPPYRAWELTIGDRALPLYNIDQTRMAAVVPAGLSGAALITYRPTQSELLLLASLISGCLVLGAFAAMSKLRHGKSYFPQCRPAHPRAPCLTNAIWRKKLTRFNGADDADGVDANRRPRAEHRCAKA